MLKGDSADQLQRKLRDLQEAGVDIDRLPGDLKLAALMKLSASEAFRLTANKR